MAVTMRETPPLLLDFGPKCAKVHLQQSFESEPLFPGRAKEKGGMGECSGGTGKRNGLDGMEGKGERTGGLREAWGGRRSHKQKFTNTPLASSCTCLFMGFSIEIQVLKF